MELVGDLFKLNTEGEHFICITYTNKHHFIKEYNRNNIKSILVSYDGDDYDVDPTITIKITNNDGGWDSFSLDFIKVGDSTLTTISDFMHTWFLSKFKKTDI